MVKNPPASAGDTGLIPESGRFPGGGRGNPLQYCWLENPMDRGAWRATVHRVTKSQTRLSNQTTTETSASPEKDFNLHVSSTFQELGKMPFDTHFLGPHAKVRLER